jgi:hypothetical protein
MAMLFWPGLGASLLAIAAAFLGERSEAGTLVVLTGLTTGLFLPLGVVMCLWGGLRFRVPLWLLPGWSKESIRGRRQAERRGRR